MDSALGAQNTVPVAAAPRRTLPRSVAYVLAAYVIGLGFFAAVTPSPLYRSYSTVFHFSALTLTLVYATYALGVLATLLVAGSVSDDVGRRPVLLVSLAVLMASTVLFFYADSVVWLFIGRGLQGLATGTAISSASAALLDLHPRRDAFGVGLANGVASSLGIAAGILTASVLVQLAWLPLMLPYALLFVLLAVAFAGAWWMPEPVTNRHRLRMKVERPHVPPAVRRPFALASLAALSSWSLGGLFFSLGPQLGISLFHSTDTVVAGIGIVALGVSAALAQLFLGRTPPWLGACLGSVALAVGVLLIVLASAMDSGALYLIGSVISGAGFGIGFLGGLRALVTSIPAEHRASVMSAFYVVAYASLSVPAVLAGLVVGSLGLQATFEVFGLVVIVITVVTAIVAWRLRPPAAAGRG
jgi:MFS family permease